MLDPALQLALRERPPGSPVMHQRWRDLLFLHFACEPGEIAPLLPSGVEIDTFPDASGAEKAWIGFVPFRMEGIRWSFSPPVPGAHSFPETNVRTYVHHRGADPGVWFFSLDAFNALAVATARLAFSLPYFYSRMSVERKADAIEYRGERRTAHYGVSAILAEDRATPEAGTLEFFLVERYLLYSVRQGRLWSGRVWHPPYRLRQARLVEVDETLVRASGIRPRPFVHAAFSEGVDVQVFPLRRVA